jgi:hypothetical protein
MHIMAEDRIRVAAPAQCFPAMGRLSPENDPLRLTVTRLTGKIANLKKSHEKINELYGDAVRTPRRLEEGSRCQNHKIFSLMRDPELPSKQSSQRAGVESIILAPGFSGSSLFW